MGRVRQHSPFYPDEHLPTLKNGPAFDFLIYLRTKLQLKGNTVNQTVCALGTFFHDHPDPILNPPILPPHICDHHGAKIRYPPKFSKTPLSTMSQSTSILYQLSQKSTRPAMFF